MIFDPFIRYNKVEEVTSAKTNTLWEAMTGIMTEEEMISWLRRHAHFNIDMPRINGKDELLEYFIDTLEMVVKKPVFKTKQ